MSVTVPHFALPFRSTGTSFCVNEQGSEDDIVDCVKAVLLTEPGERQMLPEFGLTDQSFTLGDESLPQIAAAVSTWEPRADEAKIRTAIQAFGANVGEANNLDAPSLFILYPRRDRFPSPFVYPVVEGPA